MGLDRNQLREISQLIDEEITQAQTIISGRRLQNINRFLSDEEAIALAKDLSENLEQFNNFIKTSVVDRVSENHKYKAFIEVLEVIKETVWGKYIYSCYGPTKSEYKSLYTDLLDSDMSRYSIHFQLVDYIIYANESVIDTIDKFLRKRYLSKLTDSMQAISIAKSKRYLVKSQIDEIIEFCNDYLDGSEYTYDELYQMWAPLENDITRLIKQATFDINAELEVALPRVNIVLDIVEPERLTVLYKNQCVMYGDFQSYPEIYLYNPDMNFHKCHYTDIDSIINFLKPFLS